MSALIKVSAATGIRPLTGASARARPERAPRCLWLQALVSSSLSSSPGNG
jgi:hypothetical protein